MALKYDKYQPKPIPANDAIAAAVSLLSDWELHYYQVLYFQKPPLTSPDSTDKGSPFSVRQDPNHRACIRVKFQADDSYSFSFGQYGPFKGTQDEIDEKLVEACRLIQEAKRTGRAKVATQVCCPLAEVVPCMCLIAFKCPIHGGNHIGSHD